MQNMINIGDLVKRVSRNNETHYGLVIAIEPMYAGDIPGVWYEVQWTNAKCSPTLDKATTLEVISEGVKND